VFLPSGRVRTLEVCPWKRTLDVVKKEVCKIEGIDESEFVFSVSKTTVITVPMDKLLSDMGFSSRNLDIYLRPVPLERCEALGTS